MWQHVIATVSSLLVLVGAVPLYVGIFLGTRRLTFGSWMICSATALTIAVAYGHVAPLVNIGPPICMFVNALIAFVCMTWAMRHQDGGVEVFGIATIWLCLAVGGITLTAYLSSKPSAAPYVLYGAMAFDAWIVSGSIRRLMRESDPDGALTDVLFGVGYVVSMFGITEHTVATWALPIYMGSVSFMFVVLVYFQRIRASAGEAKSVEGA